MPEADDRLNLLAGAASVITALVLVVLKAWAFRATGALSVGASLADSLLDLLVSLVAFLAIRYAQLPPDEDHAFGHGSAEDLAALGQAILLGVVAVVLAANAVARLLSPAPPELTATGAGIVVMVVSIGLSLALVLFQGWVARRTGNRVVAADRLHYLSDLLPALGAVLALLAARHWGVLWIDSLVALAAASFILIGAIRIGRGAWDALMDRSAGASIERAIAVELAAARAELPGLHGWHDLRTRRSGSQLFVNLHLEIDGSQPLRRAHDIAAAVRRRLLARFPGADVIIHKDPVDRTPAAQPPQTGQSGRR